jgi:hypothetical protein
MFVFPWSDLIGWQQETNFSLGWIPPNDIRKDRKGSYVYIKGFARGSPRSVLLAFSQSYVEHDLRKNKIVVPFFYQPINFYELIVRF